jgi:hypothetical protein
MAKKITNETVEPTPSREQSSELESPRCEEGGQSQTPDIQPENTEQPAPVPEPPKEAPAAPEPAPETEKQQQEKASVQAIPDHADRILKTFSTYPELYIDAQGGTYTVDSPPVFHTSATLYTNPYYKR